MENIKLCRKDLSLTNVYVIVCHLISIIRSQKFLKLVKIYSLTLEFITEFVLSVWGSIPFLKQYFVFLSWRKEEKNMAIILTATNLRSLVMMIESAWLNQWKFTVLHQLCLHYWDWDWTDWTDWKELKDWIDWIY